MVSSSRICPVSAAARYLACRMGLEHDVQKEPIQLPTDQQNPIDSVHSSLSKDSIQESDNQELE